jgi:hypothetical protein
MGPIHSDGSVSDAERSGSPRRIPEGAGVAGRAGAGPNGELEGTGAFTKRLELGGDSLKRVPPWADSVAPACSESSHAAS